MSKAVDRVGEALDIVRRAKALGDYDTNVIGMAAEIVAEEHFEMKKVSSGTKNIDGYIYNEGTSESMQVKAFSSSRVAKYKEATFFQVSAEKAADRLLVILFYSHLGSYEVLYHGDTSAVGKIEANGKTRAVRLDSLKPRDEIERILKKINGSDEIS